MSSERAPRSGRGGEARAALLVAAALAAVALAALLFSARDPGPRRPAAVLRIQVASSLGPAFDELARAFETEHPGARVESATGASLLLARRLLDIEAPADLIAVADAEVFDAVLLPRGAIRGYWSFCGERLVIACAPGARHQDEIGPATWTEILRRPGVRVGRADPDIAPLGYRTLLALALAEQHYAAPGLARDILARSPRALVRPNAAALLALVETGEVDYAFDYRGSVAARGLRFVELPPDVHLGDPARAPAYASASVAVAGPVPGTTVQVRGAPIRYAIAIPEAARQKALAREFLSRLFGPRGRATLARHGFEVYDAPLLTGKVP